MNCTIFQLSDIGRDRTVLLSTEKSLHLRDVLKKRPGDAILAGLVNGPLGMVTIVSDTDGRMKISAPSGPVPEPHPVDVILAMPRPKVMKRLWAQLASIGIGSIYIIGAEQVAPFYFDSHALDEATRLPHLIEGLEQARDTRLPNVTVTKSFHWFVENKLAGISRGRINVIGHPGATSSIRDAFGQKNMPRAITLAIGPEGGWTSGEIDRFKEHGFYPVGMRDRALRTDTAIISLLALVYDAIGA
jgi:16S rRNA (uracil1498-N3)-methyltransferase